MISLIIPMYNSEQTIEKTLRSVINQTVAFSEVIVIDNGSSDKSVEIVSEIAQQYSYINLLICETRGVSAARNMGIDVAKSPYISFLDADDILETSYVEEVERCIFLHPSEDMYHFNFYQQFKNGIIEENPYFLHDKEIYTGQEFLENTLKHFSFEAKHMVWSFVFKKSFLNQYNLRFNVNIRIFEDILFLHEAWSCRAKIRIVPGILVQYCYYEKSLTNKVETEYFKEALFEFVRYTVKQPDEIKTDYYLKLLSKVCTFTDFRQLLQKVYNKPFIHTIWIYSMNKVAYMCMKIRR